MIFRLHFKTLALKSMYWVRRCIQNINRTWVTLHLVGLNILLGTLATHNNFSYTFGKRMYGWVGTYNAFLHLWVKNKFKSNFHQRLCGCDYGFHCNFITSLFHLPIFLHTELSSSVFVRAGSSILCFLQVIFGLLTCSRRPLSF